MFLLYVDQKLLWQPYNYILTERKNSLKGLRHSLKLEGSW